MSKTKKLKKWQKAIIISVCIIAVLVVGYFGFFLIKSFLPQKPIEPRPIQETIYEKEMPIEKGTDAFVEGEIKSTPIKLSSSNLNSFKKYLSDYEVKYDYSDYYDVDAAYKNYTTHNTTKVTKHAHDVRVNGKLDADALFKIVTKNNEEYFAQNKFADGMNHHFTDEEIMNFCQNICKILEEYQVAYPEIDMDTICCNLYSLKMFYPTSTLNNGAVTKQNIFYISDNLEELREMLMNSDDLFKTTIYHEVVHLCQVCCECYYDENTNWKIGFCNDYNQAELDPMFWTWLIEASAEMNESSYLDVPYSTYTSYIGYARSLNLVAQLDPNNSTSAVERLSFGHDAEDFFKYFRAETEAERKELIHMMYSIELMQMRPKAFTELYEQKTGNTLSNDKDELNLYSEFKTPALLTLSKYFYRNLAEQINRGDTTLEDAYYLMRVFEADLDYHLTVETYKYYLILKDFFPAYTEIQDEFFRYLSEENGIDTQELIDGFENYSMNIKQGEKTKSPNCDLKFMPQDKKDWIDKNIINNFYMTGYPTIRECIGLSEQVQKEIDEVLAEPVTKKE